MAEALEYLPIDYRSIRDFLYGITLCLSESCSQTFVQSNNSLNRGLEPIKDQGARLSGRLRRNDKTDWTEIFPEEETNATAHGKARRVYHHLTFARYLPYPGLASDLEQILASNCHYQAACINSSSQTEESHPLSVPFANEVVYEEVDIQRPLSKPIQCDHN